MRACTKIGCVDGLAIEVNSTVPQSLNVTVRTGDQVIHTFRCDAGQACRSFIDGQTPAHVTVVVEMGGTPVSKSYQPEYRASRPNGPDCEPVCRQGSITLAVS